MTSVATPIPDLYPGRHQTSGLKFALALGLVALADWLLYGERAGISLVFFAVALICTSLMANFDGLDRRRAMQAALIFLAGLVPAVEGLNPLSFLFLLLALGSGIAILTNPDLSRLRDGVIALRDLFLIGPFRSIAEVVGLLNLSALSASFVLWFVPLALPAIDKARRLLPNDQCLVSGRARLIEQQRQIMASWRRWSFQSFRLQRTLDKQQNQPASG
jgi:hypothetical protein